MIAMHTAKTADPASQQKSDLSKMDNTCSSLLNKRYNYCSELNRQKYKRCRIMAKYCNAKIEEYRAKYDADEGFGDEWLYWIKFMRKWMRRWLELARDFKEGRR